MDKTLLDDLAADEAERPKIYIRFGDRHLIKTAADVDESERAHSLLAIDPVWIDEDGELEKPEREFWNANGVTTPREALDVLANLTRIHRAYKEANK
jgi:hypothetical protein